MKATYRIEKSRFNSWICYFFIGGHPNTDCRGTDGTGLKFYATKEKAEAAGKRYLKKMSQNGFEI